MMYVLGGYALFLCFRVFLTTQKQRYAASLCALCVYSCGDLKRFVVYLASGVATTQTAMTVYERDGFIQPGPLTLTVGSVLVILAIGLIGFYVQNGSRLALIGASIVGALSALLHPFEVFGIIAGTSASLLAIRRERWRTAFLEIAAVAIPACLIILMYMWLSLRTDWTAELTTRNQFGLRGTATIVLSIPLIAAVALFVIGPRLSRNPVANPWRMLNLQNRRQVQNSRSRAGFLKLVTARIESPSLKRTSDIVLKCWFGSILVTMFLPLIPFRLHLIDGLAVVMSLFLVRQLAAFSFAPRTRQIAVGFCAILLGVSLAVQGLNRYIMFDSGNQTSGLSSAVAPDEENLSVNWLRAHGKPDDLVLAPAPSAPWIATAPIHSYGSHWLASLLSPEETDVAQRFYAGKVSAEQSVEFLAQMGIKYVLVPVASPAARLLRKTNLAANLGTWMVYKFPENQMSWYLRIPGHVNRSIAVRLGYARPK
jgi:hypothetical protein